MRIGRIRFTGILGLFVWALMVCVVSGILYGGIAFHDKYLDRKKNIIVDMEKHSTKEETLENKIVYGNDIRTYIELLKMPVESAFQTIRVMITNKKDNSIFYKVDDFANVKKELESKGYRGNLIYQRAKNNAEDFVVINELP